MKWSEHKSPTEQYRYDHVTCETPLGKFIIDWKSWKDNPSYDVMLEDQWVGVEYDLELAKNVAYTHLKNICNKLNNFFEDEG